MSPISSSKREAAAARQRAHRARRAETPEIAFSRPDWQLFLNPDHLSQKAGCPRGQLQAMVLKELVDNALDAGVEVTLVPLEANVGEGPPPRVWAVTDSGKGFSREQIVQLFAVNRALTSSKLVRRPTRGAIGNGLRVVMGGTVASGGRLQVESRGRRYVLDVDLSSGDTVVTEEGASEITVGTRVTIAFGPELLRGDDDATLAELAIGCAGYAAQPMHSHPSWYTASAFTELVHAAPPGTTVADIAAVFGVVLDDDRPATAASLDDLKRRAGASPKLVPLGPDRFTGSYAKQVGLVGAANVPAMVEVWAKAERCPPSRGHGSVTLLVNRSPVIAPVKISSRKEGLAIFGCNLSHYVERVPSGGAYSIVLAITSPVIPITTEGKEPDLKLLWGGIQPALAKAMRAAHRATQSGVRRGDVKDACSEIMEEAYLKASANNTLPANARQIFYAARPLVQEQLGSEISFKDTYFTQHLLPDFIEDNPELTANWDVVYDARGHLTEPHTEERVPLGTLQVRKYAQPRLGRGPGLIDVTGGLWPTKGAENRFSTLLFIEKEGFEPLLRAARIAERFDCAFMSTKGMASTAARQLIDRVAQEGVTILAAHDFDIAGATIVQTISENTRRYGFAADPNVIDIGLDLPAIHAMDLQDEEGTDAGAKADKLREYGRSAEEIDFLITRRRRVELNAMTSDQFVAWLEGKLSEHGSGKVVPSDKILEQHARQVIARRLAAARVARLQCEVEAEAARAALPANLARQITQVFDGNPELPWEEAIERVLDDVTRSAG